MKPFSVLVVVVWFLGLVSCETTSDDSYLVALKHTKDVDTLDQRTSRNDFQPSTFTADNSISTSYSSPTDWDSSSSYSKSASYGPPAPTYGPPSVSYGPPQSYEVNRPIYAAVPTIHQVYYGHSGPPSSGDHHHHYPPAGWEGPREENWLLSKLKFKLDFFTIGKILLKLIIFKKIVKFIAVICLLLFLPKLQAHHEKDQDDEAQDERRQLDIKYNLNARINEMTTVALTAIDAFTKKYPDSCTSPLDVTCRLGKMINAIDERYPYKKVIQLYLPENEKDSVNDIQD